MQTKVRANSRRRAGGASALLAVGALALHGVVASATTANTSFTWSGGGTDALWSDGGNWVNGLIPIDNGSGWVLFPQLSSGLVSTQDLAAPFFIQNLTFTGSGYAVGGGAIRIGGSLTDSGGAAGMNTIANNIVLTGALPVTAADLELSGAITPANGVMNAGLNVGASNILLTLTGTGSSLSNLQIAGGGVVLDGGSLTLNSTSSASSTDAVAVGLGTIASAAFTVQDGATLDTSAATDVGIEAGSGGMAQMTVTGAKTLWKLPSNMNIGENGSGSVTITSGATVTGGALSSFTVGDNGAGSLVISGGGTVSNTISQINSGSTAQVTGTGSTWTSSDLLIIGAAQLSVQSGGAVSAGFLFLDTLPGFSLTVTGGSVTAGSLVGPGTASLSDPAAGVALTINGASSAATFSGDIEGTGSLLKTGASTQTLSGVNTYGGSTTISGGTLIIAGSSALPSGTAVSISNGGALDLANHGTSAKIVAQMDGLTIDGSAGKWNGLLDLSNNDLIVHNGNFANVSSQIIEGFNSPAGNWTGAGGITSSAAAATNNTALAAVLNNNGKGGVLTSLFDNQPVIITDVLIKYTFYGDANLDGVVNSEDYLAIDNGFNKGLTGWNNGDFNYDGKINGDDYTLIDNAFNSQGTVSFSSADSVPTEIIAVVPEPASLGLFLAGVGLMTRMRRVRMQCNFERGTGMFRGDSSD